MDSRRLEGPEPPPGDMDRLPGVSATGYYGEYHGHLVNHLEVVHRALREHLREHNSLEGADQAALIWTAGDSRSTWHAARSSPCSCLGSG